MCRCPVIAQADLPATQLGASGARYGTSFGQNSSGLTAVAYFKSDRKLYLLRFVNLAWTEELASNITINLGSRNYTSLVYRYDLLHIIFYDSVSDTLQHAWRSVAGNWTTGTIDSSGRVGSHLSAIACGNAEICVSYYDIDNTDLKFAKGRAGSWNVETVEHLANDIGQFSSITVNNAGRPVISYYDATAQLPKVAEQAINGSWQIETLPNIATYGRWTSIVHDTHGTTHLSAGSSQDAYTHTSDGRLYYAEKPSGGNWSVTVLPPLHTSASTSISLLPNGHPQIAARNYFQSAVFGSGSSVRYVYQISQGIWQTEDLYPNLTDNNYNSIKTMLDPWGNAQIGYYYTNGSTLGSGIALNGLADNDHDLLPNTMDPLMNVVDFDGDGFADGYEVIELGTSPILADSDSDGNNDAVDLEPLESLAANLVRDGNCERPLVDRWTTLNSPLDFLKDEDVVAEGTRGLFINGGGSGYRGVMQQQLSVNQNTSYRLQLYYKRSSGTARIRIGWGNNSDFENAGLNDNSNEGWQSYVRDFTTPSSIGDLRLLIDTDGVMRVDAIQLYAYNPHDSPIPQPTVKPTPTPTEFPMPGDTPSPPTPEPTAAPKPLNIVSQTLSKKNSTILISVSSSYGSTRLAKVTVNASCNGRKVAHGKTKKNGFVKLKITRSKTENLVCFFSVTSSGISDSIVVPIRQK